HDVVVRADVDQGAAVAELQGALAIGRLGGLLEQEQELRDARLAGAVRAEQDRERRQADVAGVAPGLEVLQSNPSEHAACRAARGSARRRAAARAKVAEKCGGRAKRLC